MSRRGELCLQRIIISYGITSGCPAVRQALSREIPLFKRKFPSVVIDVRCRRVPEASITGVYADGSEKSFNIKSMSSQGIWIRLHRLVNTVHNHDVALTLDVAHLQRRSVQGAWNPWLWITEGNESRVPIDHFDRRLTDEEWDYYTDNYSEQLRSDHSEVSAALQMQSAPYKPQTEEVSRRWEQHVTQNLQSDFEHNISHHKREAAADRAAPKPPTLGEYSLFAMPDIAGLADETVKSLQHKEFDRLTTWWEHRRQQLKPP